MQCHDLRNEGLKDRDGGKTKGGSLNEMINEQRLDSNRTVRDHKSEDWKPGSTQAMGGFDINDESGDDETNWSLSTKTNKQLMRGGH